MCVRVSETSSSALTSPAITGESMMKTNSTNTMRARWNNYIEVNQALKDWLILKWCDHSLVRSPG